MRVTNSMLVSNFINDLYNNMSKLSKLQSQMASGRKYAHISDDPISVIFSQQARFKLAQLEHYRYNVDTSGDWLAQAETGCIEIESVLARTYECLIDARTKVKTNSDRANIAREIGQLRDHILQMLNTTIGDKYVYSSYNTTGYSSDGKVVPPFTVDKDTGDLLFNGLNLNDPMFLPIFNNPAAPPPPGLTPAELDAWNTARDLFNSLHGDIMKFDLAIGTDMSVSVNGIDLVFYGGSGTINVPVKDANGKPIVDLVQVPVMEPVFYTDTVTYLDEFGNTQLKTVEIPVLDAAGNQVYREVVPPAFRDTYELKTEEVYYNNIYNLVNALYRALNSNISRDDLPNDPDDPNNYMYNEAFNKMMNDLFGEGEGGGGYLGTFIKELQNAQQYVLGWTADIGGRTNRVDMLKTRYDTDFVNYTQMLSDAEDIDYAEVIMNFKMAESVYRAALASGASIIQPTLMDFLRR